MAISDGISTLSERERETLRLLLAGHDAKSIARHLGLSVHTVNERLRDARRKVGVSSSREAARLLAQAEPHGPNSLGDDQLGVTRPTPSRSKLEGSPAASYRAAWLAGGMLIMSLIVAAIALLGSPHASSPAQAPANQPVAASADQPEAAGERSAIEWVTLLDRQQWDQSWATAGTLFKSKITAGSWASTVQSVRHPLGAVSSRKLQSVTAATKLPGAPDGQYEILQFQTNFANKSAVETVVLAREASGWKVDGYFIR